MSDELHGLLKTMICLPLNKCGDKGERDTETVIFKAGNFTVQSLMSHISETDNLDAIGLLSPFNSRGYNVDISKLAAETWLAIKARNWILNCVEYMPFPAFVEKHASKLCDTTRENFDQDAKETRWMRSQRYA